MKTKFNLADVLSLIAIMAYGFFVFLSANFLEWGNMQSTIVWTAVAVVLFLVFSFGAKLLKQTSRNFIGSVIFEFVFLIGIIVTSLLMFPKFAHFLAVSDINKEIKQDITNEINNGRNMFANYETYCQERITDYSNNVQNAIDNKSTQRSVYLNYGFKLVFTPTQDIAHKTTLIDDITEQLKGEKYDVLKKDATVNYNLWGNAINNWKPLSIIPVINSIDETIQKYYNTLVEYSSDCDMLNEDYYDFSYDISVGNDARTVIETYNGYSMLGLVLAIILFIFMVLPYLVAGRSTKFPGWRNLFNMMSNQRSSNEL